MLRSNLYSYCERFQMRALSVLAILSTLSLSLAGCGKEEFVNQQYEEPGLSVGFQVTPAKADILIVTDNSASFSAPYYSFQNQLRSFVSNLTSQGWDYHVSAIPLVTTTTYPTINQVLASSELNGPTLSNGMPNPGYNASSVVPANNLITDPARFNALFSIISNSGSNDMTFYNLTNALYADANLTPSARFLRPDSLLAIIVITNGNDFSGSTTSSWMNSILSATNRAQRERIRFYPIASQVWRGTSDCWGAGATQGSRYFEMANLFNSPTNYDFCTSNMSDVIADIASNLRVQKTAYVTRAIFLGVAPIPSSIVITKRIPLGNGQFSEQVIPANDPVNGWTYSEAGQPRTDYTILEPYSLDQRTGYMIELHGSGRIRGNEQYSIRYERR